MNRKILYCSIGVTFILSVLFFPPSAEAVPSLGVASGEDWLDRVINDQHAFILQGGELTIWFGRDGGLSAEDLTLPIYLVTNSTSGASFTFNGESFGFSSSPDQADGYYRVNERYYVVSLGTLDNLDDSWNWTTAEDFFGTTNDDNPFIGGNKEFFFLSGSVSFPRFSFSEGDWLFAIADHNNFGSFFENGNDEFSPKTTSTTVPEPSTLLLLGSGLVGLGLFGRKWFRKS